MIPLGDDNFESIPIDFDFKYFSQTYTHLKISTNGYVFFKGSSKCCLISQPVLSNLISGLNYDLNTLNGGKIFYQNINLSSQFLYSSIKADLMLYTSNEPTYILRITFDNVHNYENDNYLASFQLVLASCLNASFIILKYSSCVNNLLSLPGLYFMNSTQEQDYIIIENPCNSSNVNSKGLWIFEVTDYPSNFLK